MCQQTTYAQFVAERLAAGDDPNTIRADVNDALRDALGPSWRFSEQGWIPAVKLWCVRCHDFYWKEYRPDGKCLVRGHNAPLLTDEEWDARQAANEQRAG